MFPALSLALLLAGGACPAGSPPADANAFVRGLVGEQRQREEALSRYAYDILETRERLDKHGVARHKEIRGYQVFHVRGRPVRRQVTRDGHELSGKDRVKEDQRTRELAQAIGDGHAISEKPGVRLSRILERYDFEPRGAERVEGRCVLVFDFEARQGGFEPDQDELLRNLAGRLWVDEEERAVARLEIRNTQGLRFALGLGAAVSTVSFQMAFSRMKDGVWLPRRLEAYAEGRRLVFFRFRSRRTAVYSSYRRFEVGVEERVLP